MNTTGDNGGQQVSHDVQDRGGGLRNLSADSVLALQLRQKEGDWVDQHLRPNTWCLTASLPPGAPGLQNQWRDLSTGPVQVCVPELGVLVSHQVALKPAKQVLELTELNAPVILFHRSRNYVVEPLH